MIILHEIFEAHAGYKKTSFRRCYFLKDIQSWYFIPVRHVAEFIFNSECEKIVNGITKAFFHALEYQMICYLPDVLIPRRINFSYMNDCSFMIQVNVFFGQHCLVRKNRAEFYWLNKNLGKDALIMNGHLPEHQELSLRTALPDRNIFAGDRAMRTGVTRTVTRDEILTKL